MDANEELNAVTVKYLQCKAHVATMAKQLDELDEYVLALRKAFEELLEQSKEYRERLGIPNEHYEQDWLIKAKII